MLLMMQIFDVKLEGALKDMCIKIWFNARYMDDGMAPSSSVLSGSGRTTKSPVWRLLGGCH